MKKIFLGLSAIAAMLFASCAQDELVSDDAGSGDEIVATFELTTPQGIQTRAIGDGTSADVVACAVYDAAGNELESLRNNELTVSGKKAIYSIRLVKGQSYRVAFFAYNKAAAAYDVTDMKNIKVKDSQKSNIEARDAFTAYIDVTASETMNAVKKEVRLYRPFAQLNLGSVAADIDAAAAAGIVVKNTKVIVNNMYTAFSAYQDEVVGGTSTQVFNMNAQPTDALSANGETYDYLALNYILVGDTLDPKALTTVTFEWEAENGYKNSPATEFNNVPVQRNYRTNILGYLLTNPADFNIVIDEEFKKPDTDVIDGLNVRDLTTGTLYATITDAVNAGVTNIGLAAGTFDFPVGGTNFGTKEYTIKGLGKDVTFLNVSKGTRNVAGSSFTFEDLNMTRIAGEHAEGQYTALSYAKQENYTNCIVNGCLQLMVSESATIKDCQFNNTVKGGFPGYSIFYYSGNGSTVTVENTKFNTVSKGICLYNEGRMEMNLVVRDCDFVASETDDKAAIQMHTEYGIYGTLTVSGTTATGFADPMNNGGLWYELMNNGSGTITNNFVKNCTSQLADGLDYNAATGEYIASTAAGLKYAISNLNNVTVRLQEGTYQDYFLVDKKTITLVSDNNATIDGLINVTDQNAHLTLRGLTLTNTTAQGHTGSTNKYLSRADGYCLGAYNGSITIENCTFDIVATGAINAHANAAGDQLTITGTTFNCNGTRPIRARSNTSITGCTFNDQYRYAVQVQANNTIGAEKVVFKNNVINNPCETSDEMFAAGVSISGSQICDGVAFEISGNTLNSSLFSDLKFVYDINPNVYITTCTLNGTQITESRIYNVDAETNEVK